VSESRRGSPVGVVVATRDRRESLLHTLGRLASLPESPTVAVVDNGSRDGTSEAVRRAHPEARLLRLDEDAGGAARNAGVRAVDTPLVAFSDDDSWWAPGALTAAGRLFDEHPGLGLIAARVLVNAECRLDPTCVEMRDSPLPADRDLPGPPVLGFVACGSVVRRSAFLQVGGFEPRMGIGGEEQLLALDLAAAGWGLAYVEEVVAHHHPWRPSERPGRRARELRNSLWVTWLRRPLRRAAVRTAMLVAASVRERNLSALLQAARGAPWVIRERRRLPAEVERAAAVLERGS
jgi:GT2 family glycosyltransferase